MRSKIAMVLFLFTGICVVSCVHRPSPWKGTWLVVIENGKDMSKNQVVYTLTDNTISQFVPGLCKETGTLSVSKSRFTALITESNCSWSFVGKKISGTLSLKEDRLTLNFPEHGKMFSQTCVRKK